MSDVALKIAVLRSLHSTWKANNEEAQRELFAIASAAIAGTY